MYCPPRPALRWMPGLGEMQAARVTAKLHWYFHVDLGYHHLNGV
jgi:hypothetical protein